jgi:hypothetical protein
MDFPGGGTSLASASSRSATLRSSPFMSNALSSMT